MRRSVASVLLLSIVAAFLTAEKPAPPADASSPQGYFRSEDRSFLSLPLWYIVFNSAAYAHFIQARNPSDFPYVESVKLFWKYYGSALRATKASPFNVGYQVRISVIGVHYSAALLIEGAYEKTIGRLIEGTAFGRTAEDKFAADTAADYVAFIRARPWYEFPFKKKLVELWHLPWALSDLLRQAERKVFLGAEYGVRAGDGWLVGKAMHAVYSDVLQETYLHAKKLPENVFLDPKIRRVRKEPGGSWLIALPRYQPFTTYAVALAKRGADFADIAGNGRILVSVIIAQPLPSSMGETLILFPIPTDPKLQRQALIIPVSSLAAVLRQLTASHVTIEHIFDY
jgi:hypothetical protein